MHYGTQSEISREPCTNFCPLSPALCSFPFSSPITSPSFHPSLNLFFSSLHPSVFSRTFWLVHIRSFPWIPIFVTGTTWSHLKVLLSELRPRISFRSIIQVIQCDSLPSHPLGHFSLLLDIQSPQIVVSNAAFPLAFYSWYEGKYTTCYSF